MFHARNLGVIARRIVAVGLRRITVDERARIKRVRHAAHFVLDGEEHLAAVEVDDVLKAILVLIAFLGD